MKEKVVMRRTRLWWTAVTVFAFLLYWNSLSLEKNARQNFVKKMDILSKPGQGKTLLHKPSFRYNTKRLLRETTKTTRKTTMPNLEDCFRTYIDWKRPVTPRYKLSSDRFLIPNLHNGPNNQIVGFQEAAMIAIILNRTLVLPPFYYHQFEPDDGLKRLAKAEERLDVNELRKLVSVIPIEQAAKTCNHKLDAVFHEQPQKEGSIIVALPRFHLETGIRGVKYKPGVTLKEIRDIYTKGGLNDSQVLEIFDLSKGNNTWLTGPLYSGPAIDEADITGVQRFFESPAKCVLYHHPFRQFGVKTKKIFQTEWNVTQKEVLRDPWSNLKSNDDAAILLTDIIRYSPPPQYVRRLAQEYINQVLTKGDDDRNYVAAHWRYDKEDFYQFLCVDHFMERRKGMCAAVRRASNPLGLAKGLANLTSQMGSRAVYVAAPPTLNDWLRSVHKKFDAMKTNSTRFFSTDSLKEFIFRKNSSRKCENHRSRDFTDDLVSQVELEICSNSGTFLWSVQSTWSGRAKVRRNAILGRGSPGDRQVLKFVVETLNGGKKKKKKIN